jgi:hypothetical protein
VGKSHRSSLNGIIAFTLQCVSAISSGGIIFLEDKFEKIKMWKKRIFMEDENEIDVVIKILLRRVRSRGLCADFRFKKEQGRE